MININIRLLLKRSSWDRAIPVNSFDKTFDNQQGLNIHITTSDIPKVVNP